MDPSLSATWPGGILLEVHCSSCRPERHLYIDPVSVGLRRRMPVPAVANNLGPQKIRLREHRAKDDLGEAGCAHALGCAASLGGSCSRPSHVR
jgi:hypothetical protein